MMPDHVKDNASLEERLAKLSAPTRILFLLRRVALMVSVFCATALLAAQYLQQQSGLRLAAESQIVRTAELANLLQTATSFAQAARDNSGDPETCSLRASQALEAIAKLKAELERNHRVESTPPSFSFVNSVWAASRQPREARGPVDMSNLPAVLWIILFVPLIFAVIGVWFVIQAASKETIKFGLDAIKYIMGFYVGAASTFFGVALV